MLGSVENLIDGADGVQSLRLDGRKACNIKRVGISQAENNKATVCALPSIHLPLTREASVMVRGEGLLSFCNGCGDGEVGGRKAIPPVVARIFSGDSTSPLTREARI